MFVEAVYQGLMSEEGTRCLERHRGTTRSGHETEMSWADGCCWRSRWRHKVSAQGRGGRLPRRQKPAHRLT